jgi:hypothetical protein
MVILKVEVIREGLPSHLAPRTRMTNSSLLVSEPLAVRIGIASGVVVIGDLSAFDRRAECRRTPEKE